MSVGVWQFALIVLVVVLIFGAKRIPEIARALGKAQGEFKKAKDEIAREAAAPAEPAKPDPEAEAQNREIYGLADAESKVSDAEARAQAAEARVKELEAKLRDEGKA